MFTGLIEEVGTVVAVQESNGGARFTVQAARVLENIALGDSIAVDGACMTAVSITGTSFDFEASPESLSKTVLTHYQAGRRVNLERPLTPTSRIGGHYVTGHVDGLARVVSVTLQGNSILFTFEVANDEMAELMVPKGSVAVLGISLTVNTVEARRFSVAIIPHTLAHTNLDDYQPGDTVNIETDLLGKYARRLLLGGSLAGSTATDPVVENDFAYRNVVWNGQRNATSSGVEASAKVNETELPASAAELAPGVSIDVSTLVPATNAIRSTQAFSSSNIRTGGWFNFEHEPESSSH